MDLQVSAGAQTAGHLFTFYEQCFHMCTTEKPLTVPQTSDQ